MNCPRVLLTGANGFIGAHVLDVLLKNGAFVQAIVRGPEKAARLRKDFSAFEKTRLDFSIVPDITVEGCFDKCMQECQPLDAVVHTAAPLAPTEFSKSLGPMLQGTLEILRSVSRHAPTVKRVVITGSFSSIGNVLDIQNGGIVYSSDSWNPITMEQAKFSHGEVAYWAGKTIAEKAAWEFVQNEKPPFELVVLCPTAVYGPLRHSIDSIKDLNSSNNHLYENFFASSKELPVPEDYVQSSVDVRVS
ncbi:Glycine-rich RNA-binding protein 2, mitochondrial [Knufia peltigerae]|uniref:Glycine-rich RNA-binding protein 2, mitochondrial n=1 Tax=Knufia peltigerae TaxID=1002370 RepID=A0AA38YC22_9EURO|nr:Glycine-rich RNA-binding protein 2, mitochondrial [Knufia peltigerae]